MLSIRIAQPEDAPAIWRIMEPVIRAGETYALPQDMSREDALDYWMASDGRCFVAEDNGRVIGTYGLRANRAGAGAHVANASYMTAHDATGRGVARAMCEHSITIAKELSFRAMQFNFVVASNERAVRLWHGLGFETVGRLPEAFLHPTLGYTEALVMFRRL